MPDLIDSDDEESLIEDKELDWRDMPHLMNLDNEINTGDLPPTRAVKRSKLMPY